jgi:hypothetical protein
MRRSTLVVLVLAGLALAACAKKSSIYLDSGRKEAGEPQHPAAPPPNPAASAQKSPRV